MADTFPIRPRQHDPCDPCAGIKAVSLTQQQIQPVRSIYFLGCFFASSTEHTAETAAVAQGSTSTSLELTWETNKQAHHAASPYAQGTDHLQ